MPNNPIKLSPSFISPIKAPSNLSPPIIFHGNSKLKHFSLVMISKNLLMDLIHAHQPLSQKIILLHPPKYHTWTRQDKLIFGALVGSFTPIIPLIQQTKTSCKARTILTNTYAHFSRGHIKQIKDQLKHATKGFQMITKYMQFIKTHVNELALLGKPIDGKDLIKKKKNSRWTL